MLDKIKLLVLLVAILFVGANMVSAEDIDLASGEWSGEVVLDKQTLGIGETINASCRQTGTAAVTTPGVIYIDNTAVATITPAGLGNSGTVTGVGVGTATITCKWGQYMATKSIMVNNDYVSPVDDSGGNNPQTGSRMFIFMLSLIPISLAMIITSFKMMKKV